MVADVGCGPAATSVLLAREVGPTGRVIGVERDPSALAAAHRLVASAGVDNVELREGLATDTGLEPASVDVAMMRHVLAHNGPQEQQIVDHLSACVRPGGVVYLLDVDFTAGRVLGGSVAYAALNDAYIELHRRRGNDLQPGLRLGELLAAAGLEVLHFAGSYQVVQPPTGIRPPAWAARASLLNEGLVSQQDLDRWEAEFIHSDSAENRPTVFLPSFAGIGRRTS